MLLTLAASTKWTSCSHLHPILSLITVCDWLQLRLQNLAPHHLSSYLLSNLIHQLTSLLVFHHSIGGGWQLSSILGHSSPILACQTPNPSIFLFSKSIHHSPRGRDLTLTIREHVIRFGSEERVHEKETQRGRRHLIWVPTRIVILRQLSQCYIEEREAINTNFSCQKNW